MTCPRCQGLVLENYGEQACVNCGWFPGCPVRVPGMDGMEEEALCQRCHDREKALNRSMCRPCLNQASIWERARKKRKLVAQEKVAGPSLS